MAESCMDEFEKLAAKDLSCGRVRLPAAASCCPKSCSVSMSAALAAASLAPLRKGQMAIDALETRAASVLLISGQLRSEGSDQYGSSQRLL
jgi:hypothetical protein